MRALDSFPKAALEMVHILSWPCSFACAPSRGLSADPLQYGARRALIRCFRGPRLKAVVLAVASSRGLKAHASTSAAKAVLFCEPVCRLKGLLHPFPIRPVSAV